METRFIRSESFRLTAIFVGFFMVAMLILTGVLYGIMKQTFEDEIILNARQDLAAVHNGYLAEGIGEAAEVVKQRLAKPMGSSFVILESVTGRKIAGNLGPMAPRTGVLHIAAPLSQGGSEDTDHDAKILGVGEIVVPGVYAFAGQALFAFHATKTATLQAVGWILAITFALAVMGGTLASHSFLKRMDTITRTCQAIMEGRLSDRIPLRRANDELGRLALVINAMLDRINVLMESVRQITNDVAHDLRTPLTRLRNRLEMMRSSGLSPHDYRTEIDHVIEDTEGILSTFGALLRIGQIEAGAVRTAFQQVDLKEIITNLAEIYKPAAEDRSHFLSVSSMEPAVVVGDKDLLSQMLVNLIENAISHTPDGCKVVITLKQAENIASLTIADNGPGIPADERENVLRRFYRLEKSRSTPGSGLGLSLVAAIVQIHHGTVVLMDNDPGLCVIVTLSLARSTEKTSRDEHHG